MHSTETLMGKWILPQDILWISPEQLGNERRERLELEDNDIILTRQASRSPSKVLDQQTANFIQQFNQAKTLAEAIVDYAQSNTCDPNQLLDQITPLFRRLTRARLLLSEEDIGKQAIKANFQAGHCIDDYCIEKNLQTLEDSEVYLLQTTSGEGAVLKIARPERAEAVERLFHREAQVLQRLNGKQAPALLQHGEYQNLPYMIMQYMPGRTLAAEAMQRRNTHSLDRDQRLVELLAGVAESYAGLHEQGVLHGDVHPRNGLLSHDKVWLIDFGLATWQECEEKRSRARRGGIPEYYDPDYAQARLQDKQAPQQNFTNEQYSLGALLFMLATGNSYLDFAAERNSMYQQIVHESPRRFSQLGLQDWPQLEDILHKALAKQPDQRWPSLRDMAGALRAEQQRLAEQAQMSDAAQQTARRVREQYVEQMLAATMPVAGSLPPCFNEAPLASVNYGASGLALALLRIAEIRQDAHLLAVADLWNNQASAHIPQELQLLNSAFHNKKMGIAPDNISSASVYHGAPGVYWVQAMISASMGDFVSCARAMNDFASAAQDESQLADYTLGSAGALTGCAMMLCKMPDGPMMDFAPIIELGESLFSKLCNWMSPLQAVGQEPKFNMIGGAHGWTGLLLALLSWCECSGREVPVGVKERLQQLAKIGKQQDRLIAWPRKISSNSRSTDWLASWCNGSAGLVPLWTTAWRLLGDNSYLELAALSAAHAEHGVPDRYANLCCGLTGRSYALLDMYTNTHESSWLRRAEQLANIALEDGSIDQRPWSLFKGRLGVALLMEELKSPDRARVPLYGYHPDRHEQKQAAARLKMHQKKQQQAPSGLA